MKNKILKSYIYFLIATIPIGLAFATLYYIFHSSLSKQILYQIIPLDLVTVVLSIVLIVYVAVKKLNKIHLVLPIFFVTLVVLITIYGNALIYYKGITVMNLSYWGNILYHVLVVLSNMFIIFFGVYLLRKKV